MITHIRIAGRHGQGSQVANHQSRRGATCKAVDHRRVIDIFDGQCEGLRISGALTVGHSQHYGMITHFVVSRSTEESCRPIAVIRQG